MRRLFLAALIASAAAAAVAPASADSYNDATTGLYVSTPDDFIIRHGARESFDLVLHINPTGSYPSRVEGEPGLCSLIFKAMASTSGKTQQWLNSRWKDEAAMAQFRRYFERFMEVKSEETFNLGDVVGLELVGPMRQGPEAISMTSVIHTPRGQLQLSCLLRSDQAVKAAFAVRAIRDTIRPPK